MMWRMPPLIPAAIPAGSLADTAQPVLPAGGGLLLSPWGPGDALALLDLYADPAVRHWHGFGIDSDDEARGVIGRWQGGWAAEKSAHWKVTRGGGGELVGRIGLLSMSLRHGCGECLYSTVPAARGQGAAPLMLAALCRWAFGDAGFHRIELRHSVVNPASCRVAEKSGFPAEGTEHGAELHEDGWHDMHLHARVNS